MSARVIGTCLFALTCGLAGDLGDIAWDSPDPATLRYLGELLKKNIPGITDEGVRISCSRLPVELLLDEEILEPRFGFLKKKNVLVTSVFQYPRGCKYLSEKRRDEYEGDLMRYSEASTKKVRAFVTITELASLDGDAIGAKVTILEAEFQDQCDVNKDGKWDLQSCWKEVDSKEYISRVLIPAKRSRD